MGALLRYGITVKITDRSAVAYTEIKPPDFATITKLLGLWLKGLEGKVLDKTVRFFKRIQKGVSKRWLKNLLY